MKPFALAFCLLLATPLASQAAESDAEFAQRLHQHMKSVTRDPRIIQVARQASPSNVTVEFKLDAQGRVGKPKIVHSILSQEDQKQIVSALADLPPIALEGYSPGGSYRLPLRLEYTEPQPVAQPAQN